MPLAEELSADRSRGSRWTASACIAFALTILTAVVAPLQGVSAEVSAPKIVEFGPNNDELAPNGRFALHGPWPDVMRAETMWGPPLVASDGAIWFAETLSWHPRIVRMTPKGAFREFPEPWMAFGAIAYPALATRGRNLIVAYDDGRRLGNGMPANPVTLAIAPDGTVSHTSRDGCIVAGWTIACFPTVGSIGPLPVPPDEVNAAVLGPDGAIWFAETGIYQVDRIGRIDADRRITYFTDGLTPDFSGPQAICVGPDGALWFTELRDRVGRITTDGVITEFSAGIPHRSSIGGITAGRDGNLWFTLYHGNELARMTPAGVVTRFRGGITPSRGNDFNVPMSIPTTDAQGRIWFNESQGGRLARAVLP